MMENNIDLEEIPEGLPKARIKLKKRHHARQRD